MTKLYPVDKIIIKENRQRQKFDAQADDDLRTSIETVGLLHAPILREEGDSMVLVAGETRIRQIKDIWALGGTVRYNGEVVPEGMIPYTTLGELTELEAEEAELDENLKRKDLTWQELAAAQERLHDLRLRQSNIAIEKAAEELEKAEALIEQGVQDVKLPVIPKPHTIAETAQELYGRSDGGFRQNVVNNLALAKHLDNPEVAKAKSPKEALKILQRQEDAARHAQLAAAVGKTFSADSHTVIHADCLQELAKPGYEGKFDVILTDPPYGMGADTFGDGGGKLVNSEHHYDDSYEAWITLMKSWAPMTWHVTKSRAHLYAFCDFDRFHELKAILTSVGWDVFRTPFVIRKINSGRVPRPEHGPRRQYELCLYAIKGNKTVNMIQPDVIEATGDDNIGHGAQKPVSVYQNLLQRSVQPGDSVLDCFGGSGPMLPAAHACKVSATVIEREAPYYGMCLKRAELIRASESNDLPGLF